MCSIVASSNIVHDEINTVWKEIKFLTFNKLLEKRRTAFILPGRVVDPL